MGLLTDYPQLSSALNGDVDRFDLFVSGVAITGEIAALAQSNAADIRGARWTSASSCSTTTGS
jgi:hypothetical protein